MNIRESGLAAMVLLLYACAPEPPPTPPPAPVTATELRLRDSLELLRTDYDSLRLWEALDRGRRLRVEMEAVPDSVGAEVKAEVYQYLGMLHFHRGQYMDSTGFYTERAGELLLPHNAIETELRQILCRAYASFAGFLNVEQEIIARYGRQRLEELGRDRSNLYAFLLVTEARGHKQQAYDLPERIDRAPYFARATQLLRAAASLFRENGSPWETFALDHLGILLSKDPAYDPLVRSFLDTLGGAAENTAAPVFGNRDRFLGGWHWERGRKDSMAHYYQRLVENSDRHFQFMYPAEAFYMLKQYAEERDDYEAALDYLERNMALDDCCVPEKAALPDCDRRPLCSYYVNALASVYQQRYQAAGDLDDHARSLRYSRLALAGYESVLQSEQEEGIINETSLLGQRIIDAALRTAVDAVMIAPNDSAFTAVLQAMEVGKTLLLNRELFDRSAAARAEADRENNMETLRAMEVQIRLLKERYLRDQSLRTAELEDLNGLLSKRDRLARTLRRSREKVSPQAVHSQTAVTIADVRRALAPRQALIEFAETEAEIIALYLDADTAMVASADRRTVVALVDSLQAGLKSPTAVAVNAYATTAYDLYRLLLEPFCEASRSVENLAIVPTNSLQGLPLAALVTDVPVAGAGYEDLSYLVDRYTLRYLASWSANTMLKNRVFRGLADDVAIGVWTHPGLTNYLGGLATKTISTLSSRVDHYVRGRATTASFLQSASDYDILHLSAHATGNPDQIDANYLYFASGDSLNGVTIGGLPLRASLVVLAACSTAQGYASGPEGTYSLRRSFHLAGVPDVVSSLYDLPAAATAKLLEVFYGRLRAGDAVPVALRYAQQECLRGGLGVRYVSPPYWAGLIVG